MADGMSASFGGYGGGGSPSAPGGYTEADQPPEVELEQYKRLFTEARDLTQSSRQAAKRYRRYYDGKPEEKVERELKRKKHPDFSINRVRPGIEGLIGVVEQGKAEPRALPRTEADQGGAEVATKVLGYISDVNRWPRLKLKVFRNMLVEGTCAVLTEVDEKLDVRFRQIRYEEYFYDPYCREDDFTGKSYDGIAKWLFADEIIAAYPEKEAEIRLAMSGPGLIGGPDSTWDDRPAAASSTTWSDPKRKRLLVVEMYKRERGVWMKCVFTGALVLEHGPCPYLDENGQPANPIEAASAYIDDDNYRYGAVADMAGPQDEINLYRRKGAHRATFRQAQEVDAVAAYADPEEVRKELARPDGVIPPGYQVVPDDKFAMDMTLLAEAKAEIERLGPNPAILGRQGADASGRSVLIRQQAGLTELAHLFAALDDLEHRIYAQAWNRVRQYWHEPKFIRVTDTEGDTQFLKINDPVFGPPQPVMDPNTGLPAYDPMTRQIRMERPFLGMRNDVSQMDVDIKVDTQPDTANVQQEQYNGLIELAKVGALGPNPGMYLLKASSLPNKRELIEELQKEQAAAAIPAQQQQQMQQQALAVDTAQAKADIEKTQAQTLESRAKAAKTAGEAHANALATSARQIALQGFGGFGGGPEPGEPGERLGGPPESQEPLEPPMGGMPTPQPQPRGNFPGAPPID